MMIMFSMLIDDPDDLEKFNALFMKHTNMMLAIAYKILKDKSFAEDVVQESWLYVAKNFESVLNKSDQDIQCLLFLITKHRAYNLYKKRANEHEFEITIQDDSDIFSTDNDEIPYTENIIRKCINQLPQTYIDIVRLYYICGTSSKDIARALGEKNSTIQKRITRGKKMLIDMLAKEGITERDLT